MRTRQVLKTKICLVGEQAVGKTSLVHRFVSGAFNESYIRTLGTVVSKKQFNLDDVAGLDLHVDMTILDIMGMQTFMQLFLSAYFRGASGVLAVADLTRRPTLEALESWIAGVESVVGKIPVFIVVNKADLEDRAEYGTQEIQALAGAHGAASIVTSAKTGARVDDAFHSLARLAAEHQIRLDTTAQPQAPRP